MAGWISSKLKVAESFLQQIDQQAAESLGKNEKPQLDDSPNYEAPAKSEVIPLKEQLRKKAPHRNSSNDNVHNNFDSMLGFNKREHDSTRKPFSNSSLPVTDSDWTELLSAQEPITSGAQPYGSPARWKDPKIHAVAISSVPAGDKRTLLKSGRKLDSAPIYKVNSDASDGDTRSSGSLSAKGSDFSDSVQRTATRESEEMGNSILTEAKEVSRDSDSAGSSESGRQSHLDINLEDKSSIKEEKWPITATVDCIDDFNGLSDDNHEKTGGAREKSGHDAVSKVSIRQEMPKSSWTSDNQSDSVSGSGSSSTSDSENENEMRIARRKRKEQIRAEKAAAKAVEAIKERENIIARLEGEKQTLEKILDERAKQQAQEALELQMNMKETMEAVDLEKQKHNNTRMEALARLAKLETMNADLAKSLASTQKSLESEVNRFAELRQQLDLKEVAHEELRRRISSVYHKASFNQMEVSKGVEFEQAMLKAEHSFVCDKTRQLLEKAKDIEESIEVTRKEMHHPTEVEVELSNRLTRLTDHLIQKQAQVESLSAEKAMLVFRLETASRLIEEGKPCLEETSTSDIESGKWEEQSNTRLRPVLQDRIRTGRKHLGSILGQLDAIFCAGVVFLRRNPAAKTWSIVYLICLHFWVSYVLLSHSRVTTDAGSGAVVSLANVNTTSGALFS